MNKNNIPLVCCNCGNKLKPFYSFICDYISGHEFAIYKCIECDLGHTVPQPADLKKYYDKTYYGNRHGFTEKHCIRRRSRIVFSIIKNGKGKRLLDIGCGDGSFIKSLKSIGWNVSGTEINPDYDLFENLNVKEKIEDFAGAEPFDCITMWHTLEHMPDIKALTDIYSLLAPNGKLIIAVPNNNSIQARLFKNKWLHLDVPRHMYHFDADSLSCCLKANGFIVERNMWQEFEYDLLGWVQSALNSLFKRQNIFFDHLRGRKIGTIRLVDIVNLLLGYTFSVLFSPIIIFEKIINNSGTIIVVGTKYDRRYIL